LVSQFGQESAEYVLKRAALFLHRGLRRLG